MKVLTTLISACTLALTGCGAAEAGKSNTPETLPQVQACFVTQGKGFPVTVEVVSESEDRKKGLMGRNHLAENAGMVFEYQEQRPARYGFWMYKTLIPLDIAFLDESGVIVSIRHMLPCTSSSSSGCPIYPAGKPFRNAVEMNAGYFKAHHIDEGDRLIWPSEGTCPP
ncbi:hypothetical protein MARI_11090 [Marinobacter sp. JH2]|uniref:DUF192 domain-containing protein n=1 Tax=Marinobacter sp. AL4B TaxID=2871173 RepID=UPI001056B1C5|nr:MULTISPECIES: DUF192 domain-containing protein [unclassified Marinobacter]MBZ0333496.1 DUF192 domain-containing protein [Marinobacter sp. AL4B]QBM17005.1 hypothetical protein MARI_11090 [Marinobacter sp. JH2]